MTEENLQIEEARRVTRVDSKGRKTRKIKCKRGFKRSGNSCVPITGSEKASKKRATRKAVRTKRQQPGSQRRASRKRLKAMRKRKSYGL